MSGFFKIFANLCGSSTFTDTDTGFPIKQGAHETIRHFGDGSRRKIPLRPTGLSNVPRASYHERIKRGCETLQDSFDKDELKAKTQLQHFLKKWQHEDDGRYVMGRKAASAIIESAFSKKAHGPHRIRCEDTTLKFEDLDLGCLPRCLSQLRSIQTLQVENCQLTKINAFPLRMTEFKIHGLPNLCAPSLPSDLTVLHMTNCELTTLPSLPDCLEVLDISNNNFTSLATDEALPKNLVELVATHNQLEGLGELPTTLQTLNVKNNSLTCIPRLPEGLYFLDISNNEVSRLPNFPSTIQHLFAAHNQFSVLPDELAQISDIARIDLRYNPIPEQVFNRIANQIRRREEINGRRADRFSLCIDREPQGRPCLAVTSMNPDMPVPSGEDMPDAVLWWYHKCPDSAEVRSTRRRIWKAAKKRAIDSCGDASAGFGKFLVRLVETAEYRKAELQQGFKKRVIQLLDVLATDRTLRKKCYLIAQDALGECQDRVALGLEKMQLEVLNAKAKSGELTEAQLIDHCKSQFKLEKLRAICAEKIDNQPELDEIEVYLYFQVKLAKLLDLPISTETIAYPDSAKITESDIHSAILGITGAVADHDALSDFMSRHSPWKIFLAKCADDKLRTVWNQREVATAELQEQISVLMEGLQVLYKTQGELSVDYLEQISAINRLRTKFDALETEIDGPVLKEMTLKHLNAVPKPAMPSSPEAD